VHLRHFKFYLILFLSFFEVGAFGQKLIHDSSGFFYEIAPLYDFKESAVSLTFDDGYINQFLVGLPLLIERKLPVTFYIVTKGIDEINEAVTKSELNGYEIGSHTVNHRNLILINKASVDWA